MSRGIWLLLLVFFACEEQASDTNTAHPSALTTAEHLPQQSAAPPKWETPTVSPLLRGEQPPLNMPNYFDAKELGSGAIDVFLTCMNDTHSQGVPSESKCLCLVDAALINVRARRSMTASAAQRKKCEKLTQRADARHKLSQARHLDNITSRFLACLEKTPKEYPTVFKKTLCGCMTNAVLKFGSAVKPTDVERCALTAMYLVNTGTLLTPRQFAALRDEPDRHAHPTGPASPNRASHHYFAQDDAKPNHAEQPECDTQCKARKHGYVDAEDMAEDLGIGIDEAHDRLEAE